MVILTLLVVLEQQWPGAAVNRRSVSLWLDGVISVFCYDHGHLDCWLVTGIVLLVVGLAGA